MNWFNLKKNKCPQCNKDFLKNLKVESNTQPSMFTHSCGFKISEQKYKEIVSRDKQIGALRVSPKVYSKIESVAKKEKVSKQEVIRAILEQVIDTILALDEETK